jgi:hypothetical protein
MLAPPTSHPAADLQGQPLHYVLNCASLDCPNLQPAAFTTANTEELLEAAARAYINSHRGARMDKGSLRVCSIFK